VSVSQTLEHHFSLVCDVMAEKFVNMVNDELLDFDSTSSPSSISSFGEPFLPIVLGLLAVGHMHPALELYKARTSESLRLIVKTVVREYMTTFDPTLPVFEQEDGPSSSSSADADNTPFTKRLRKMDPDSFVMCVGVCFEHTLQAIVRCSGVVAFLHELLEEPGENDQVPNGGTNGAQHNEADNRRPRYELWSACVMLSSTAGLLTHHAFDGRTSIASLLCPDSIYSGCVRLRVSRNYHEASHPRTRGSCGRRAPAYPLPCVSWDHGRCLS
jgi:hypothetical protein